MTASYRFAKISQIDIFNELLPIHIVNVVHFARIVEWDFFCDFQTLCCQGSKWKYGILSQYARKSLMGISKQQKSGFCPTLKLNWTIWMDRFLLYNQCNHLCCSTQWWFNHLGNQNCVWKPINFEGTVFENYLKDVSFWFSKLAVFHQFLAN